jgi:hypothetical protein
MTDLELNKMVAGLIEEYHCCADDLSLEGIAAAIIALVRTSDSSTGYRRQQALEVE